MIFAFNEYASDADYDIYVTVWYMRWSQFTVNYALERIVKFNIHKYQRFLVLH